MSFREYIQKRRVTDTPAGDFTKDAKVDGKMPDAKSWAELARYLGRVGASAEAVAAGRRVWAAYQAQQRAAEPDVNQRAKSIVDQVTRGD